MRTHTHTEYDSCIAKLHKTIAGLCCMSLIHTLQVIGQYVVLEEEGFFFGIFLPHWTAV